MADRTIILEISSKGGSGVQQYYQIMGPLKLPAAAEQKGFKELLDRLLKTKAGQFRIAVAQGPRHPLEILPSDP